MPKGRFMAAAVPCPHATCAPSGLAILWLPRMALFDVIASGNFLPKKTWAGSSIRSADGIDRCRSPRRILRGAVFWTVYFRLHHLAVARKAALLLAQILKLEQSSKATFFFGFSPKSFPVGRQSGFPSVGFFVSIEARRSLTVGRMKLLLSENNSSHFCLGRRFPVVIILLESPD